MSKKLVEILSELASDVKSFSVDDRISFRYLHSKFNDKIAYFLRIEAKSREILKDFTLWQTINCLELIDIPTNTCGDFISCDTLKKSVIKLPEAYNTNYGQLLKVFTQDGVKEYNMIKSTDYNDYITRKIKIIKNVFWLENQYLFIPNTNIEAVKVLIIPKNSLDILNINNSDGCNLVLESYVNYPDYLITLAKQEVLKEVSSIYKRVVEDEKPDNNSNIKN